MYGVEYLRTYDPNDEDHVARKHRLFELPSGPKLLPDAFDCILARASPICFLYFLTVRVLTGRFLWGEGEGVNCV